MSNIFDLLNLNSEQKKTLDEFIRKNSSIRLNTSSMSLNEKNQTTIRYFYLINKFNLDKSPFINGVDKSRINSAISMLKTNNSSSLNEMYNFKPKKDAGPGEFLLYFLINSSSIEGIGDLKLNGQTFEVKSTKITNSFGGKHAYDFETGTYNSFDTISKLNLLAKELFNQKDADFNKLKKSQIDEMRSNKKYKEIEMSYAKNVVENYFKNDDVIFFDRKTQLIESIKKVKPSDIAIYRVDRGSVYPLISVQ